MLLTIENGGGEGGGGVVSEKTKQEIYIESSGMINSPNEINCRIVIRAILALIKQSLTKGGDALDIYMVESAEEIPTPQR